MILDDLFSIRLAIGAAIVVGVLIGYFVAARNACRPWALYLAVWVVCLAPRAISIALLREFSGVAAVIAGEPAMIICVAEGLRTRRARLNAARTLGASEWRVFWSVFLPEGLLWITAGILLGWGRWLMDLTIGFSL
jgi:ABC-type nitrate/sulfonate/bicarbonate transport system permease component